MLYSFRASRAVTASLTARPPSASTSVEDRWSVTPESAGSAEAAHRAGTAPSVSHANVLVPARPSISTAGCLKRRVFCTGSQHIPTRVCTGLGREVGGG
eukprot:124303-Rhodomonas_salina.1